MKTTTALSIFLATALAAPSRRGSRFSKRSTHHDSINWSGAVVQNQGITGVTATFPVLDSKIPTVSEPGKHAYLGSVWVGIDGYNTTVCNGSLWQAGVMTQHHAITGEIWTQAWYELYPGPPEFLDIGNITSGDMIKVTLDVSDPTQASAILENLSTGEGFNQTVPLAQPLCMNSAEWIVERAYTVSGLAGLLDFGTETIGDISWTAGSEVRTTMPDDVTISDIINDEDNDAPQTTTEVTENEIKVTYLGS
ncbi:concanavalin A-like lectin/glucanase [Hypoxylon sp. FL1284]|nr:concanavalin A-like lectin/glucanase [Hypoxylon sp. FL1284]